jgi:hypothetical protein
MRSAPFITFTACGGHSEKAFTGPADHAPARAAMTVAHGFGRARDREGDAPQNLLLLVSISPLAVKCGIAQAWKGIFSIHIGTLLLGRRSTDAQTACLPSPQLDGQFVA